MARAVLAVYSGNCGGKQEGEKAGDCEVERKASRDSGCLHLTFPFPLPDLPTGFTGPQGAPGQTPIAEAIQAPLGSMGLPGIDGIPGFRGDPGVQGPVGLQGEDSNRERGLLRELRQL